MLVRDILNIETLNGTDIIAGYDGLDRKISNATFIDAPDGHSWFKNGDFILTTGYPYIKNDWSEDFLNLLSILVEKKCSGLGIKLGRYIPSLPQEAIKFANENNLTIISLPNHLPWSEIMVPIISKVNHENLTELEKTHIVYEKFQRHLKENGNMHDLATLLKSITGMPVTIYIRKFKKIINTENNVKTAEELDTIISTLYFDNEQFIDFINWKEQDVSVRWITSFDGLEAGIFIWNNKLQLVTWKKAALEQTVALISLEIERLKYISVTFQRFRNEFINELIDNKLEKEVALRKATEMNWQLVDYYEVLLLESLFNNSSDKTDIEILKMKEELLNKLQRQINKLDLSILVGLDKNNNFIFLIPKNTHFKQLFYEIDKIISSSDMNITFGGLSNVYRVENLQDSYSEAAVSLNIAKSDKSLHKSFSNKFIFKKFSDLRIERIIYSKNPQAEINKLIQEYLVDVMDYDKKRNTELLLTLKTFINNDANFERTAEYLFVHKNTVRYRINTIQELLNLDLKESKNQLFIQLILTSINI